MQPYGMSIFYSIFPCMVYYMITVDIYLAVESLCLMLGNSNNRQNGVLYKATEQLLYITT